MSLTGIAHESTSPPKLARELKQRLADLLNRYTFEEVLMELAKGKPKMDIYICAAGEKRKCPHCGAEHP